MIFNMTKKEPEYAPSYVERVITPEEMKRRAGIDKQIHKHENVYNITKFMLVATIFLSLINVGVWVLIRDELNDTIPNVLFTLSFYAAFLFAALSLVFGLNAAGMASKLKSNKIAGKSIGMAVVAILIAVGVAAYITEFFSNSFPSF